MSSSRSALVITVLLIGAGLLSAQNSKRSPAPSAGKAIDNAARAAVLDRIAVDSNPSATTARAQAPANAIPSRSWFGPIILSDTGGVDFGPYVRDLYSRVRLTWSAGVMSGEYARHADAEVAIEFLVRKDGSLRLMKLVESSGDATLDQIAWTGIVGSAPFAVLPPNFTGDSVKLCFRFLYNPNPSELVEAHRSGIFPPI